MRRLPSAAPASQSILRHFCLQRNRRCWFAHLPSADAPLLPACLPPHPRATLPPNNVTRRSNVVVRYDGVDTMKALVQSRGRVRRSVRACVSQPACCMHCFVATQPCACRVHVSNVLLGSKHARRLLACTCACVEGAYLLLATGGATQLKHATSSTATAWSASPMHRRTSLPQITCKRRTGSTW